MALVFDIETNGLIRKGMDKLHCICTYDTETNTARSFYGNSLDAGVSLLKESPFLCGQNIIKYDIPALKILTGVDVGKGLDGKDKKLFDTRLVSTMLCRTLYTDDMRARKLPQNLWGKHSLESWGYRLGIYKGDYGKQEDCWESFSMDMLRYCEKDVVVTTSLFAYLMSKITKHDIASLTSEHRVWRIIAEQEEHGFYFDIDKATSFFEGLSSDIGSLKIHLRTLFPPRYKAGPKTNPKRTQVRKGIQYTAGGEYTKLNHEEFNPCSSDDIAYWLSKRYGWVPSELTPTGKPKVSADILVDLPYPEAIELAKLQFLVKIASFLWSDSGSGWLQVYNKDTQSIHGSVNPNGAATSRMTHSEPNLANIPSVKESGWNPLREQYGKLCRSLFKARPGYKIVGCDASGLELRCLAHYMARYDGGAYVNTVVKGKKDDGTDIHSVNQRFAGLPTRDIAKTFIYALIYGAGDNKIGSLVGGGAKEGKKMKQRFLNGLPALKSLITDVQGTVRTRGYLRGVDGRLIACDSLHKALNRLLQSAGAIAMKYALINIDSWAKENNIDYGWCVNVHDEYQAEVREDQAALFAEYAVKAIEDAGNQLNFLCPLTGEANIGDDWSQTH